MGPKPSPKKKKSPKKITEKLKLETKDVERFILCVKNHLVLYNTTLHDYKDGQIIV
ncbi:Uncharacterized protein APZ42_000151 [Daphnia magna]|uniref:Uncharacterized protein n=1 Tax=Daphnia magna TaxID=35525 RepID=A0A164JVS7_9CRUS|nr:Uncharacterized protein APZ42_000151 [Daphnia magna]